MVETEGLKSARTQPSTARSARPVRRVRANRFVSGAVRWLRRLLITGLVLLAVLTVAAVVYNRASDDSLSVPPLDAHGHYVRTGTLTTHYEQWGTAGSPIVLVHGFLESGSTWAATAALLGRGHRVYALDIRGYGYTERVGPYTLDSDTAQLVAFLAALHLDARDNARPMLVGHSSGAAIVGNLARLHPALASQVVFMDGDGTPYGVGPAWVHRLIVDPYATAAIRLVTRSSGIAARAYRGTCGPGCPPFDAEQWLRPFRVPHAVKGLKAILSRQLIGLTYQQEAAITVPAAVMYGTADSEMTSAQAAQTATRLHTKRIVALVGAHHLGMISDPALVAARLSDLAANVG
ncbi:alpha/beta hydrolase [Jatrophihabitans telluris]|uniref:Alpha/beta hydrolase n=1 Tax=Jatrophihabitans telluris TaxID=2038343 RepID=A0ABY4R0N1_9ACTN|nr:alpha/beta hydrolase [Jatrophihabitans telluris]UQX88681.1 alpha/beta hydrolase [Jatrophihabitans telluris]